MKTGHIVVHGRVQGVGYRAAAAVQARRLGLGGWVRNRNDGTVEALVCGSAAEIQEFGEWCRRGPRFAHVERVDVADSPVELPAGHFEVRPTG